MGLFAFNRMRREMQAKLEKEAEIKNNENTDTDQEKEFEDMTVKELKEKCEELGLENYKNLKKEELIELIKNK